MAGLGRPWPALAGHGRPRPAMAGQGLPKAYPRLTQSTEIKPKALTQSPYPKLMGQLFPYNIVRIKQNAILEKA